jgi:hypothetical protein
MSGYKTLGKGGRKLKFNKNRCLRVGKVRIPPCKKMWDTVQKLELAEYQSKHKMKRVM